MHRRFAFAASAATCALLFVGCSAMPVDPGAGGGVAGTAWEVTGVNDGKGTLTSVAAGTNVTLELATDGRAAGSAGCNRYSATYTASGDSLAFGPAAATRMMCATPGVMEQEQAFLQALEQVRTMRLEGERLELRGADGAPAIVLRRAANPR